MGAKKKRSNNQLAESKVNEIKSLLMEGNSVLEIANRVQCSATTVQKIRLEIRDKIPSWRERTIKGLTKLHTDVLANLQENYKSVPPGQIGILLGILDDKIARYNQDNNTTVTHNHLHITHKDINALFTDRRSDTSNQNNSNQETIDT